MTNKDKKTILLTGGLSTIGFVGGIVLAVHRKSGFWGGVGWAILGSSLGTGIGYVISSIGKND